MNRPLDPYGDACDPLPPLSDGRARLLLALEVVAVVAAIVAALVLSAALR